MKKPIKAIVLRPDQPWPLRKRDVYAIRAMRDGKANEGQQSLFFDLLVEMTGLKRSSFRADNARLSDFAEGARWVGIQLADALVMPVDRLPD